MRIFLSGASGNVGRAIIRNIQKERDLELAGGWCKEAGQDLGTIAGLAPLGVTATDRLAAGLAEACPDLVIDFSVTTVLEDNMRTYLDLNLNALIGTTGLTEEQLEPFVKEVKERGLRWAAIANYGLGMSLVQEFVKMAREYYPYVSIIDRHSPSMINAPSGTAAVLAKTANPERKPDRPAVETHQGVMGAEIAGAQVLSQRMPWPGAYSEHEVMLGRQDEIIRIKIEDHTSDVYMDGIFLTVRKMPHMAPGTFVRDLAEIRRVR